MWVNRIHFLSCYPFRALILIIARKQYKDRVPFFTQHDCLLLQRCHLSKNSEICAKVSWVAQA